MSPLPDLDGLAKLTADILLDCGLDRGRADAEAAYLLPVLRREIEEARSHEIDEAEIAERVTTMARMHCRVATGLAVGAF